MEYAAYIKSKRWRGKRRRFLAREALASVCYICAAPRQSGFHVHHRRYRNFGKERTIDLVLLCPPCHREVHRVKGDESIWHVTDRLRRERRHPGIKEMDDRLDWLLENEL